MILYCMEQGSLTEGLSTPDLLVQTSLDQLVFIIKLLFDFVYKTRYLNEEVNCTEPPPSVSVPCIEYQNAFSMEY
jgi:hypothetical protein